MDGGAEALCLSCGLCCDGTLFGGVPLHAGDALEPLRAVGIQILTRGSRQSFAQPCAALHERRCSVYADRPANCRTFRCEVLKRCEDGTISWREATARIGRALEIRDAVRIELARIAPGKATASLVTAIPDEAALAGDLALRRLWAPVLMRLAALFDCLQTHFVRPRS